MANALEGVAELNRKLSRLDGALYIKAMRSVLFKSTTQTVNQIKSAAPVGSVAHRTYRGRLVAPGYLKRSIVRVTGRKFLNQGKLSIAIGTKKEAWYGFLYDQGPYKISKRRQSASVRRRRNISVKPYTLNRKPWLETVFRRNEQAMLSSIKANLQQKVREAVGG